MGTDDILDDVLLIEFGEVIFLGGVEQVVGQWHGGWFADGKIVLLIVSISDIMAKSVFGACSGQLFVSADVLL